MANMREFKVTGPDGKVISVSAPENATDDEIIKIAERQFYAAPERPKVDLEAGKADALRILNSEYESAVQRIIQARKDKDQSAVDRAEGDRASIAREIQRMGGEIPGAPPTPSAFTPSTAPEKSIATRATELVSNVPADRAMLDLLAATGGAGVAKGMQTVGPAIGLPAGKGMPSQGVQGWTSEMGYGQRGGQTYKQAHEFEQGVRKGAKIGGVQPEFRFAKPPIIEPSGLQRASQFMASMPKTMGALGGLGAAESGLEMMRRAGQNDPIGAAIAGAGAVGGVASMIPGGQLLGGALSVGSPLTLYLLDKLRQGPPKLPEEPRPTMDIMGYPSP